MPFVDHARGEMHVKVVYYGPGLGGKTTNLEYIHAHSRPDHRGKLISLTTESERTLFFDLLPVELGRFRDYLVRLHLCTVPGQMVRDETRRLVLRHVDGVVFVVDSQRERIEDNVHSIVNLETNLRAQGDDPDRMPLIVQYNKRDLPGAVPLQELRGALSIPAEVGEQEASALRGRGVFETLKRITTDCLRLVGDPAECDGGRSPSILPGRRASMFPGAVPRDKQEDSGARALEDSVPGQPRVPRFDTSDDG